MLFVGCCATACGIPVDLGGVPGDGGAAGQASSGGGDATTSGSGSLDAGADDATADRTDGRDATGSDAASTDCGAIPVLHQRPGGTLYCGSDADGGVLLCATGQECCLGGSLGGALYAPWVCAPFGTACPNGGDAGPALPIMCNQIADCVANGVAGAMSCCLQGASAPADVPGCTYPKSTGGAAVVCETSAQCAPGEVRFCASQVDCPGGTTCTAGKWKGTQPGFCL
jgi:hypothetical protein